MWTYRVYLEGLHQDLVAIKLSSSAGTCGDGVMWGNGGVIILNPQNGPREALPAAPCKFLCVWKGSVYNNGEDTLSKFVLDHREILETVCYAPLSTKVLAMFSTCLFSNILGRSFHSALVLCWRSTTTRVFPQVTAFIIRRHGEPCSLWVEMCELGVHHLSYRRGFPHGTVS